MIVVEIWLWPDDELPFLVTPQITCLERTELAQGIIWAVRLWGAVKMPPIWNFVGGSVGGSSRCNNNFLLLIGEVFFQIIFLEVFFGSIYNDETQGSCILCEKLVNSLCRENFMVVMLIPFHSPATPIVLDWYPGGSPTLSLVLLGGMRVNDWDSVLAGVASAEGVGSSSSGGSGWVLLWATNEDWVVMVGEVEVDKVALLAAMIWVNEQPKTAMKRLVWAQKNDSIIT